jgi:hypothetical protein
MNQFNSVASYKINIKNLTFLYANELAEKEIMKAILFTIDTKKNLRNKFNQGNERPVQ